MRSIARPHTAAVSSIRHASEGFRFTGYLRDNSSSSVIWVCSLEFVDRDLDIMKTPRVIAGEIVSGIIDALSHRS